MRALTSKEKRLLLFLVGALFLLLNVVALKTFLDRRALAQADIAALEAQLTADRAILGQKDYWAERAQWLEANMQTDDVTTVDDDNRFMEFVESSAKKRGLAYTKRSGGPGEAGGMPYTEVFDASTVKGNLKPVIEWLAELQQPTAFRAIKQLRIRSGEPPEVVCDVDVALWRRPGGGAAP